MRLIGNVDGHGLYARWNEAHNQIIYAIDGEDIAIYDINVMKVMEDNIIFKNNTIANELSAQAKEQIQQLARNVDIVELKSDEERYGNNTRDNIGRALNIESKKITSLTEVSLDEEVERDETDLNPNIVEQKKHEATIKDINIKQEFSTDTMASSMKTIGQVLQRAGKMPHVDGKTFTKIGVVESDSIKKIDNNSRTNTTRFSLVAIATDGTVVPLDLEQDYQEGNNPREISHRVNADGRIEQDDVNSRYRIGNSGETISIKFSNGPGNIEVAYSAHKTIGGDGIEGNLSIDHQLQTRTVYWRTRKDSRDQEYSDGIYGAENRAQEARREATHNKNYKRGQEGFADPTDSHEYKNMDGNENTKDEEHELSLEQIVEQIKKDEPATESVFEDEEMLERLKKAHDNGVNLDEVAEDIKEDARRLPTRDR